MRWREPDEVVCRLMGHWKPYRFGAIQEGVCVCHGRPVGLHTHVPLVVCVIHCLRSVCHFCSCLLKADKDEKGQE